MRGGQAQASNNLAHDAHPAKRARAETVIPGRASASCNGAFRDTSIHCTYLLGLRIWGEGCQI